MAHIKAIRFNSVSKQEGCTCDRCGQFIRNIWSVTYDEGFTVNYGIECWEKVYKSGNLSKYGEKELKKVMKSIKAYEENLAKFVNGEMNEETCSGFKYDQQDENSAWYGEPFEKYRDWMINEFFPYRIGEEQKRLAIFKKISFQD